MERKPMKAADLPYLMKVMDILDKYSVTPPDLKNINDILDGLTSNFKELLPNVIRKEAIDEMIYYRHCHSPVINNFPDTYKKEAAILLRIEAITQVDQLATYNNEEVGIWLLNNKDPFIRSIVTVIISIAKMKNTAYFSKQRCELIGAICELRNSIESTNEIIVEKVNSTANCSKGGQNSTKEIKPLLKAVMRAIRTTEETSLKAIWHYFTEYEFKCPLRIDGYEIYIENGIIKIEKGDHKETRAYTSLYRYIKKAQDIIYR